MKVKGPHKKIASVRTDLTGMKYVNNKLEKYNELLDEASKHQTKLNESFHHENSEVLRVKKDPDKRLEQICADKTSVIFNNKELSQRCKYLKDIETAKDQLQIRIDSISTNIGITWCQENEENLVLEGKL